MGAVSGLQRRRMLADPVAEEVCLFLFCFTVSHQPGGWLAGWLDLFCALCKCVGSIEGMGSRSKWTDCVDNRVLGRLGSSEWVLSWLVDGWLDKLTDYTLGKVLGLTGGKENALNSHERPH